MFWRSRQASDCELIIPVPVSGLMSWCWVPVVVYFMAAVIYDVITTSQGLVGSVATSVWLPLAVTLLGMHFSYTRCCRQREKAQFQLQLAADDE